MVTNIEVSRRFEPVPELAVEARYTFTWLNGEFDHVDLSKRRDRPDRINSQWGKVEAIDLEKVPDDVIEEAREELESYSEELALEASERDSWPPEECPVCAKRS